MVDVALIEGGVIGGGVDCCHNVGCEKTVFFSPICDFVEEVVNDGYLVTLEENLEYVKGKK